MVLRLIVLGVASVFSVALPATAFAQSAPASGETVFQQRCQACHTAVAGQPARVGPNLAGVYGNPIHLADGRTLVADDAYIRESIVAPSAKLVAGFQNIMPTFQGQIDEEGIIQLIQYIKSLQSQQPGGPLKVSPGSTAVPGANPPVKLQ